MNLNVEICQRIQFFSASSEEIKNTKKMCFFSIKVPQVNLFLVSKCQYVSFGELGVRKVRFVTKITICGI